MQPETDVNVPILFGVSLFCSTCTALLGRSRIKHCFLPLHSLNGVLESRLYPIVMGDTLQLLFHPGILTIRIYKEVWVQPRDTAHRFVYFSSVPSKFQCK